MAGRRGNCALLWTALVTGGVLLLAAVLTPWWMAWQARQEQARDTAERIARYRSVLATRPALEKGRARLRKWLDQGHYLLTAENPELAAAELQKKIKKIVLDAGGDLVSTQTLTEAKRDQGFPQVVVQVRMKGDMGALGQVFYQLESGTPVITIEDLSLRGRRIIRGRRGKRVESYIVDANFKVSAYLREKKS